LLDISANASQGVLNKKKIIALRLKLIILSSFLFVCYAELLVYALLVFYYQGEGRLPDGMAILGYIDSVFNMGYQYKWDYSDLNNVGIILLYSPEVWLPYSSFVINICLLCVGWFYFSKTSSLLNVPFKYVLLVILVNSYIFYASFTPNKEIVAFALYSAVAFYFIKGHSHKSLIAALILSAVRPIHSWVFVIFLGWRRPKRAILLAFLFALCFRYLVLTSGFSGGLSGDFIGNRRMFYAMYSGSYNAGMFLGMLGFEASGFVLNIFEFLYNVIANLIGGFNTVRALFINDIYHPSIIAHFIQFIGSMFFFILFCFASLIGRVSFSRRVACLALVPLFFISANPFPHARYYYPFMPLFMLWSISSLSAISFRKRTASFNPVIHR
jgi:hypothetical protein